MRGITFLIERPLDFQVPLLSIITLHLFYIALDEELFWRSLVQSEFGIVITSFGFGLLHFIGPLIQRVIHQVPFSVIGAIIHFTIATLVSLFLGWIRL